MMLNLREIRDFPARVKLEEDASLLGIDQPGLTLQGKVFVNIEIVRSDYFYYGNGQAECAARFDCSRCLEPFDVTLIGEVEFSIQEVGDFNKVSRDDIPDTEILMPAGEEKVDISGPIRESLLLEIPLKPLCSELCRGLCPRCGVNRNETECECREEEPDPRWDALRKLKR